jgi:hypothetical protein
MRWTYFAAVDRPPAAGKVPPVTPRKQARSSPEELTFVVGRWLRTIVFVLDMVHRLQAAPISSREQMSTLPDR